MYGTVNDAITFFGTRLNSDIFLDATTEEQEAALETAFRAIEQLNYLGTKAGVNEFPRVGGTGVPISIIYAQYELAILLMEGANPEEELSNLRMVSMGYATARATFSNDNLPEHILAGIPSSVAYRFLKPYLRDSESVTLRRI